MGTNEQTTTIGPKEVALLVGCKVAKARALMAEGEIESWRAGKLLRTVAKNVDDYKARNSTAKTSGATKENT